MGGGNGIANWFQSVTLNAQRAFLVVTQSAGQAFQVEVPSGPQAKHSH